RGAGIIIVPMCSPEMHSFRTYADLLLRHEEGTASVLCNCIVENNNSFSSVIAVTPDGRSLQPAIELRESKETVVVFEIDLKELAPHRKSPLSEKGAIGNRLFYSVQRMTNGYTL